MAKKVVKTIQFFLSFSFLSFQLHMVFWDNTNYATFELAAEGEDGLAVVSVMYEVRHWFTC